MDHRTGNRVCPPDRLTGLDRVRRGSGSSFRRSRRVHRADPGYSGRRRARSAHLLPRSVLRAHRSVAQPRAMKFLIRHWRRVAALVALAVVLLAGVRFALEPTMRRRLIKRYTPEYRPPAATPPPSGVGWVEV